MCSQVGRLGGLPLTFPWAGPGWACFKGHVDRLRGQQGGLPQEAPPLALGLLQPASRQRPGRTAWWSGRGPSRGPWALDLRAGPLSLVLELHLASPCPLGSSILPMSLAATAGDKGPRVEGSS